MHNPFETHMAVADQGFSLGVRVDCPLHSGSTTEAPHDGHRFDSLDTV